MWREVVDRCVGGGWARSRCWFVMGGATANSLAASYFGRDRMTRWHRANPGAPRCRRIWIRAWGRIERADERTGRLNREFKGGLEFPANQEWFNLVTWPALLHDADGRTTSRAGMAWNFEAFSDLYLLCSRAASGDTPAHRASPDRTPSIEVASGARASRCRRDWHGFGAECTTADNVRPHSLMGKCSSSHGAAPNQPTGTFFGSRPGTRRRPERLRPSRYDVRGERASAKQGSLRTKALPAAERRRIIRLRWMLGNGEEDREQDYFRFAGRNKTKK